jgi:hypothetical protein
MRMLSQASFRNFKNLRNVDVDLARLTVLVGPNGTGKTSVLQGLSLLAAVGQPTNQTLHPFVGKWDPRRVVSHEATKFSIGVGEAAGRQTCRVEFDLGAPEAPSAKLWLLERADTLDFRRDRGILGASATMRSLHQTTILAFATRTAMTRCHAKPSGRSARLPASVRRSWWSLRCLTRRSRGSTSPSVRFRPTGQRVPAPSCRSTRPSPRRNCPTPPGIRRAARSGY